MIISMDSPADFFTHDGNSESILKPIATPISAGNNSIEENEQLRIPNDLFGSPTVPNLDCIDYEEVSKARMDFFEADNNSFGTSHCDRSKESKVADKFVEDNMRELKESCETSKRVSDSINGDRPSLTRRRSNPFYCPSRQIVDLVKKRRRSKAPSLTKSQSTATIMTRFSLHTDAGPSGLSCSNRDINDK